MLYLLMERLKGSDSVWAPWLQLLPQRFTSPLFFGERELDDLRGTTLYHANKWDPCPLSSRLPSYFFPPLYCKLAAPPLSHFLVPSFQVCLSLLSGLSFLHKLMGRALNSLGTALGTNSWLGPVQLAVR